jgi:hypothetical protein
LQAFQRIKPNFIVGNGWDQNDWQVKSIKADLDAPDISVV